MSHHFQNQFGLGHKVVFEKTLQRMTEEHSTNQQADKTRNRDKNNCFNPFLTLFYPQLSHPQKNRKNHN